MIVTIAYKGSIHNAAHHRVRTPLHLAFWNKSSSNYHSKPDSKNNDAKAACKLSRLHCDMRVMAHFHFLWGLSYRRWRRWAQVQVHHEAWVYLVPSMEQAKIRWGKKRTVQVAPICPCLSLKRDLPSTPGRCKNSVMWLDTGLWSCKGHPAPLESLDFSRSFVLTQKGQYSLAWDTDLSHQPSLWNTKGSVNCPTCHSGIACLKSLIPSYSTNTFSSRAAKSVPLEQPQL